MFIIKIKLKKLRTPRPRPLDEIWGSKSRSGIVAPPATMGVTRSVTVASQERHGRHKANSFYSPNVFVKQKYQFSSV